MMDTTFDDVTDLNNTITILRNENYLQYENIQSLTTRNLNLNKINQNTLFGEVAENFNQTNHAA